MRLLLATLVLGIIFILVTGDSLPPVVASHFAAGGAANGFMPRATYLRFMVTLVVGLPLLIALLASITSLLPVRFINLPNREYWLAPERQADSLAYLRNHSARFGVLLVIFLCYVHWLVVRANLLSPALFPESMFFPGMAVFLVCLVLWLGTLVVHFRR
jgi:uncharacterized membrane protein